MVPLDQGCISVGTKHSGNHPQACLGASFSTQECKKCPDMAEQGVITEYAVGRTFRE